MCSLGALNAPADSLDDELETSGSCALPQTTALDSELGSVGIMKNMAEHPESIRAVAKRLLTKAVESPAFKQRPDCSDRCSGAPQSQIIYKVEPTVFLAEEKQQAICLELEEQTKSDPMFFGNKDFGSIEKLNNWLTDFSQGRGDDGKQLYEQCGANCSPRYTFYISQNGDGLNVSADVLCGLARDRKADSYAVSTAIRWQCRDN